MMYLMQAVVKRMVTDVPLGVLFSGGLDSSLLLRWQVNIWLNLMLLASGDPCYITYFLPRFKRQSYFWCVRWTSFHSSGDYLTHYLIIFYTVQMRYSLLTQVIFYFGYIMNWWSHIWWRFKWNIWIENGTLI
jgi:hypothetical protein